MASRDLLGVVTSYSSLRPPARPCGGLGRGPGPRQPRYKLVSIIPRLGAARPPVGGGKTRSPKTSCRPVPRAHEVCTPAAHVQRPSAEPPPVGPPRQRPRVAL